jgi:hypothetical protein
MATKVANNMFEKYSCSIDMLASARVIDSIDWLNPTTFVCLSKARTSQVSTLTYFSTCPFGQLTKKSTCPNLLVVRKNLIKITKTRE